MERSLACLPASYNLRPGGRFYAGRTEGGLFAAVGPGSLERVSATTLAAPAMWRMSEVCRRTAVWIGVPSTVQTP